MMHPRRQNAFKNDLLRPFLIIFLALVLPDASNGETINNPTIRHGKDLVEKNCAQCHATGIDGESPNAKAPPFWDVATRRPVSSISDMLVNQAGPKHSAMPNFSIARQEADDIAAWINFVQPIEHGRRLVRDNCSKCHAFGLEDKSNHPEAPPFRELSKFYPIDTLEEAFAEGIDTGHPDMPVFQANITQLQDIISYIQSIQKP